MGGQSAAVRCNALVRICCKCFKAGGRLFLFDAGNGVIDLRQAILQFEAGGIQRRTPIIGQGAADRQTVATDRFGLRVAALFQGSLEGLYPSSMLLQLRFGMSVRIGEWLDSILEGMKLTELMGHLGEDKSHRTADRFFSIGDHPCDWHLELVQLCLDFAQQRRQIAPPYY